jgi:hypothetical protein
MKRNGQVRILLKHSEELCGFYRSSSIARTVKFKDMMDSAYSKNVGDKEIIQNFGGETSWKMTTLKTENKTEE